METTTRRRGRPPGPTQTLSLFLHQVRSRVRQEIIISGFTVRELRAYIAWAGRLTMMARDEVMVRTVDHALAEKFKRDKLWRKEREAFLAQWDADEQRRKHRDVVEPTS